MEEIMEILIIIALICLIPLFFGWVFTCLIIWAINGIFDTNISDKFWYIYVSIVFIIPMLRNFISINIKK